MSGLGDLYQAVVLDHGRQPRNFGPLPESTHDAEGYNPLCGDQLTLHLEIADDTVRRARFEGSGCAISTASASLMTQALTGRPLAEVRPLFERFHDAVTGKAIEPSLGKLRALAGVSQFPMRVKCATLAWHTLIAALEGREKPISTEDDG